MDQNGWELISSYSRAQALADGTLIAPPQTLCEEAGFIVPVALTQAVWEDCVAWNHTDTERTGDFACANGYRLLSCFGTDSCAGR